MISIYARSVGVIAAPVNFEADLSSSHELIRLEFYTFL